MSIRAEGPAQKAEETIGGIVSSFAAYARTFVSLLYPVWIPRHLFVRLGRLRTRNLLAPPLLFLSISSFLFSIVIGLIDSDRFSLDVKDWLGWFKEKASLDVSLTQIVFTILPIFFWVLLLGWLAQFLVSNKRRRRVISRYFFYAFGVFGAGFFLWFLGNSLVMLNYTQSRGFWMRHRSLDSFRIFVSISLLLWVLLQPFALSHVAIWRMNRTQGLLKSVVKSALGIGLMALIISGSVFIQGLPKRFNAAIAQSPKQLLPRFVNWRDPTGVADIRYEKPDSLVLRSRVVAQNPRDTSIFIDRYQYIELHGQDPPFSGVYLAEIGGLTESNSNHLVLNPKETRVIECQAKLSTAQYQKIVGRALKFDLTIAWYEVGENELKSNFTRVLEEDKDLLSFPPLPEPTPVPGTRKK